MCIGVPMQIESSDGLVAVAASEGVDGRIERHTLDMLIVGAQPPGDPLEARQIRDALLALAVALDADGDPGAPHSRAIDALFADLVERTPQLPEHLRSG
jgi:hydrogenase expression/formation protein HypC